MASNPNPGNIPIDPAVLPETYTYRKDYLDDNRLVLSNIAGWLYQKALAQLEDSETEITEKEKLVNIGNTIEANPPKTVAQAIDYVTICYLLSYETVDIAEFEFSSNVTTALNHLYYAMNGLAWESLDSSSVAPKPKPVTPNPGPTQ